LVDLLLMSRSSGCFVITNSPVEAAAFLVRLQRR
jgi:hypothetical protein